MDDQVSEVPVVVDLELREKQKSGCLKGRANVGSNGHLLFAVFGFLYLNFPCDGMRCSYEFSWLQEEKEVDFVRQKHNISEFNRFTMTL